MFGVVEIDYADEQYIENLDREEEESEAERLRVLTVQEESVPRSEPLETLVARMRKPSPLAIDLLVQIFRPPEGEKAFLRLIRKYLPDEEAEIMAHRSVSDRITHFTNAFSDRYFELWEYAWEEDDYSGITERCPAALRPFTGDDYDRIPNEDEEADPVIVVLAYVLENPYSSEDRGSFAEAALRHLPRDVIDAIPPEGYSMEQMDAYLQDTDFAPIGFWVKIICRQTGNDFFDRGGPIEETGVDYIVHWNRPTVDELTRQYQEVCAWNARWGDFLEWYRKDLVGNTVKLLKILRQRSNGNGNGTDESEGDKAAFGPEYDPRQGRLFDLEPYGDRVGGAGETEDPA